MEYAAFRIDSSSSRQAGGFLPQLVRALAVIAAGIALLAGIAVGLLLVLPLMLAGGIGLYVFLRRRMRQARRRSRDGVIDAEYTIIEHR